MTSWFLATQITGIKNKMSAIVSDWESLNRSICDHELDDYRAMYNALLKAQSIIENNATLILCDEDDLNELENKKDDNKEIYYASGESIDKIK